MQPDYPRNTVLKMQVNCIKTQVEIAIQFLDIKKKKNENEPNNMFGHSPNIIIKGRVYLPRHGAHKARKVRWITCDGANNS